jgi:hypothetical protein
VTSGNTVQGGRVDLSLGPDLRGDLGKGLVGGGREQTTFQETASDVTRSLSSLGGHGTLLSDMRTVEESVIHRGRVELLLDLLNQLGVSLESGLLADEGRVRGVCQLNDARLNLLQGATLVAEGNCDNLARLVRRDSGGETIGRVSTGGSANVDNGGGHSQVLGLVGSRGRGILLGERRRDVLALRGEGVGDSALERKILLLGRNSGLDGRLSRLADALVGSSASNSLLGGR